MEPILITTQYEAEKFDSFIALPDNHRILFSGKYGSGKTFFLHEFFTTRKTDKIHLETAFKHLKFSYPNLDFDIFAMNSSEHIREVLIGLSCSEIEWEKQFVGIFDNDKAGRDDMRNGFEGEESDERIKHVKYKDGKPSTVFYAFLLPKPEGYEDKSYTIENCYNSSKYEEALSKALEEKMGHFYGLSIDTISDNLKNKSKTILANNAKSFSASDFDGFLPIFELLDNIRQLKD